MEDTRVYCGADAASDHYSVMKIKLKLHRNPNRAKCNARFDTQKLENEIFKSRFSVELRNRFSKKISTKIAYKWKKFTQKLPKKS